MAVTFLEPGGDATFSVGTTDGFWRNIAGLGTIATDFVHEGHNKSIKFAPNVASGIGSPVASYATVGSRVSLYIYLDALPSATATIFMILTGGNNMTVSLRITTAGVLQLWRGTSLSTYTNQIGSDGSTLSTGRWYRISLASTITSVSVNRFELFVDGGSDISITDATLTNGTASYFSVGNMDTDSTLDYRSSDIYIDDSASLLDTGDVWVTAKRPNADGAVNGFTTQIGTGGSGYGSGHSPQVNERALSTTNGWSMVGAGAAVTEEYSVEGPATGDIDITGRTVVGWLGWIYASSLVGEIASIVVGGVSSTYTCQAAPRLVTKVATSTSPPYPSGGAAVGMITTTDLTTVSLYECGAIVAYLVGKRLNATTRGVATTRAVAGTRRAADNSLIFSNRNTSSFSAPKRAVAASNDATSQAFHGADGILASANIQLTKTGSPTGNLLCKIYNVTGTFGSTMKPFGAALATSDVVDAATISSGFNTFTFTGANKITLSKANDYCVTLEYDAGDASNYINCFISEQDKGPFPGNIADRDFSSQAWTQSSLYDMRCEVYRENTLRDPVA